MKKMMEQKICRNSETLTMKFTCKSMHNSEQFRAIQCDGERRAAECIEIKIKEYVIIFDNK